MAQFNIFRCDTPKTFQLFTSIESDFFTKKNFSVRALAPQTLPITQIELLLLLNIIICRPLITEQDGKNLLKGTTKIIYIIIYQSSLSVNRKKM